MLTIFHYGCVLIHQRFGETGPKNHMSNFKALYLFPGSRSARGGSHQRIISWVFFAASMGGYHYLCTRPKPFPKPSWKRLLIVATPSCPKTQIETKSNNFNINIVPCFFFSKHIPTIFPSVQTVHGFFLLIMRCLKSRQIRLELGKSLQKKLGSLVMALHGKCGEVRVLIS